MSPPLASRIRQRRRCISRSMTLTLSSRARRRLVAFRKRMFTESPAEASVSVRGVSDHFMLRINGRIHFALLKLVQSIRAEVEWSFNVEWQLILSGGVIERFRRGSQTPVR